MRAAVGAVSREPAEGARLHPHDLHVAVQIERGGDAMGGARFASQVEKLREMLVFANHRSARIRRTIQVRRHDVEVWGLEAEELR